MNKRKKGLDGVREVRKILEGLGHRVEGPGYRSAFFNNRVQAVHTDFFDCFDLISYCWQDGKFYGHQVSDIGHKAQKVKLIQGSGIPGWVWARCAEPKIFYRVFMVDDRGQVTEGAIRWKV